MKKFSLVVIGLVIVFVLVVSIQFSTADGRYATLEEAIYDAIPYEVEDVIYITEYDNITIVMYKTLATTEQPKQGQEVEAVAFFKGNGVDGWENVGFNDWTYHENEEMTVNIEAYREYLEVEREKEFYVVFGKVNNPEITTIQTKGQNGERFEDAILIQHDGKLYYFQVGREVIVRGLNDNGEVIDRQGG